MGIFNDRQEASSHTHADDKRTQGLPSPPGVGFKITNGNYDMENKKLIKLKMLKIIRMLLIYLN